MPRLRLLPLLTVLSLCLVGCGEDPGAATTDAAAQTTAVAEERGGASTSASSAQSGGRLRLARVGSFTSPLYVTAPREDRRRIFVVEQSGRIRVVRGGRVLPTPFLDVSREIVSGGEQGLLGLAFRPDYA